MAFRTRINATQQIMGDYVSQNLSNTTTETTVFSATIKAGQLALDRSVRVQYNGSITSLLLPPTITVRVKFGGTTLTVLSGIALLASATAKPFSIDVFIANRGAANSQYLLATVTNPGAIALLTGLAVMEQASATAAIDTTVDQTLSITVQFGSAVSSTSLTTQYIRAALE